MRGTTDTFRAPTTDPMRRPLPLLLAVLLLGTQARAQCLVGNSNAPGSDPTDVEIGQSFMPTCAGVVEYVEIFCNEGGTNVAGQLRIYAGSTVTSTPVHTQAVPATAVGPNTYLRIDLTTPVPAAAFQSLTFELPMSLEIPFSGGNPYPGGRMFYNGTNAALYANSDIRFNVSIIADCLPTTSSFGASACQSFLAPSGQQWTSSGLYTDTIPNAQGCDSIITIDLEVIDLDTSLLLDGMMLTANATGVGYQWIDCDNGDQAIPGADQQGYLATAAGNYAVVVSAGGCSEQSACVFVASTGLPATTHADGFTIAPNPSAGPFTITAREAAALSLYDALGHRVLRQPMRAGPNTVDAALVPGVYLVHLEGTALAQRLVVK